MVIPETSFMASIDKRILLVTGHYGSGKTEFAVSLAMLMADRIGRDFKKMALVDLDIANPYFRSRERREMLESKGIAVYGSFYKSEITAELPALDAAIRAPLEDDDCFAIVDVGGNDSGAIVLNPFTKYFHRGNHYMLDVVNANRPETATIEGAMYHMEAIEYSTGLNIDYVVNNCHLLTETTAKIVEKGHKFCNELCRVSGKKLWCDCYPSPFVKKEYLSDVGKYVMPLGMYMRETWLDK